MDSYVQNFRNSYLKHLVFAFYRLDDILYGRNCDFSFDSNKRIIFVLNLKF